MFALGGVLYELLTGELYTKSRVLLHQPVQAIREEDRRPLTALHRGLEAELGRILMEIV